MTWTEARDIIFSMLNSTWVSNSSAITGGSQPPVQWQGLEVSTPNPPEFAFIRPDIKHVSGTQSSLGGIGNRLFNRYGILTVQCFAPVTLANALGIAESMAELVLSVYEGKTSPRGGIWFRNCRMREIGVDNVGYYQINAIVEFTYDEVK